MKFDALLILVVVAVVLALLPGRSTPPAAAEVVSTDANPFCPTCPAPFEFSQPAGPAYCADCATCPNGQCRRPAKTPDLAPPRNTPVADANGSPKRERSIVTKRRVNCSQSATCATQVKKRGFFRRIFRRR